MCAINYPAPSNPASCPCTRSHSTCTPKVKDQGMFQINFAFVWSEGRQNWHIVAVRGISCGLLSSTQHLVPDLVVQEYRVNQEIFQCKAVKILKIKKILASALAPWPSGLGGIYHNFSIFKFSTLQWIFLSVVSEGTGGLFLLPTLYTCTVRSSILVYHAYCILHSRGTEKMKIAIYSNTLLPRDRYLSI